MRALRRKNGFHADAPSAGGYRDVKYNLLYQSPTVAGAMGRAIVEVQIIVEAYLKVKKSASRSSCQKDKSTPSGAAVSA